MPADWLASLDGALQLLLASQSAGMLFGQKNHTYAIFTGRRQRNTLSRHHRAIKRIRQLNQNPGTVAHQLVGPDGTPVVQVFKNLQRILNNVMRLYALEVRHKTHAAS